MKESLPRPLRDPAPAVWPWQSGLAGTMNTNSGGGPDITIVTPSFNQGDFVEETLRSVLLQAGVALEYLVYDGGSQDGTARILDYYRPILSSLRIGPDGGQAAALASAFRASNGEVLGFVNSDDLLLPGALAHVVELFRSDPGVMVVVGRTLLIDEAGRTFYRSVGMTPTFRSLLDWGTGGFCQPSVFFRRDAYSAAGGVDPGLTFAFDYDLFTRMAKLYPFRRTARFLSAFRHHGASKSATLQKVRRMEDEAVRARHQGAGASAACRGLSRAWYQARFLTFTAAVRLGDLIRHGETEAGR